MIKRRQFIAAAASVAALPGAARARTRPGADTRPNILFIMADDLGFADVGCYGRDDIATPNIDRLARDGMRFINAYSASSVCSPTRVALITGRYPGRFDAGLDEPIAARPEVGLDANPPGFVAALRAAGYRTSLIGKWHLGNLPAFSPLKHGYERFFGFKAGGVDYFTHRNLSGDDLWEDDRKVERPGYLTTLFGERAGAEVERLSRDPAPFLVSLHFNAPHWPWESEQDEQVAARIKNLAHYDGGSIATYRAMIESMDREIGRVLGALARSGRAGNTIVVFTSDNGGERFAKTWPLSGRKGELLEGGIRVPAIVRWPRAIGRRQTSTQPIITMDWAATFLAAAAVKPQATLDGTDLTGVWRRGERFDRLLYWRHKAHEQKAVRAGVYKYLAIAGHEYLFDVEGDPQERANLKDREKATFERLRAQWAQWNATMRPYPEGMESVDLEGRSADRY